MSDVDPILLLMVGLLVLAAIIVWGLGIQVAARYARTRRRRALPWILLAIVPGPVFLGIAYLAVSYRRSLIVWLAAQALVPVGVCVGAACGLAPILGRHVLVDLAMMLGALLVSLGPVVVLSLLGPKPRPPAEPDDARPLIKVAKIKKSYDLGGRSLHVLRGVSLSIKRGEFVAILGASGSGKSTLLHLMGLLDRADSGEVVLEGIEASELSPLQRDRIRCRDIGFVFQFYHLLPELDVVENVLLPSMTAVGVAGWPGARGPARQRAIRTLEKLGLGERLTHRPNQLSGGEQQRVAIARGLVNEPKILLADEPTGNLDSQTGEEIIALLKRLNTESDQTIVMVTHDEHLAAQADRVVRLSDGKLQ